VALNVEDVTEDATPGQEGTSHRHRQVQDGPGSQGREVRHSARSATLTRDAMAALAEWRAAGQRRKPGRCSGSVDKGSHVGSRLSDRAVALIVKIAAARAGLDPAMVSGSLRSGRAWPRQPREQAQPRSRSCARPAIGPLRWWRATFGLAICSARPTSATC